jgi:hypothetical protein
MSALAPNPRDSQSFLTNPLQNENAALLTEPINSRMVGKPEVVQIGTGG